MRQVSVQAWHPEEVQSGEVDEAHRRLTGRPWRGASAKMTIAISSQNESWTNDHIASSPAAPGSWARTCASTCSSKDHRVICLDNLDTGTLENIEHIRDDALRLPQRRRQRAHRHRRAGRLRLPPGQPRQPHRLPAAAAAHAQGRLVRHPQRPRPGQVQARALPARLHLGGLRRPARASPEGDATGAT